MLLLLWQQCRRNSLIVFDFVPVFLACTVPTYCAKAMHFQSKCVTCGCSLSASYQSASRPHPSACHRPFDPSRLSCSHSSPHLLPPLLRLKHIHKHLYMEKGRLSPLSTLSVLSPSALWVYSLYSPVLSTLYSFCTLYSFFRDLWNLVLCTLCILTALCHLRLDCYVALCHCADIHMSKL